MKIRNNFIGFIIVGIVFILGGLFFAWYKSPIILSFNSAEKVYNDGYIFAYDTENYEDSMYSIAVHNMIDTDFYANDGKSHIYAVVADDAIYILEAKSNDKEINNIFETYSALADEGNSNFEEYPTYYLIVEATPDSYNQLDDVLDFIDPEHEFRNKGSLRYDIYLSKTSLGFEMIKTILTSPDKIIGLVFKL